MVLSFIIESFLIVVFSIDISVFMEESLGRV